MCLKGNLNKFSVNLLRVGISETICTQKNKIKNIIIPLMKGRVLKKMSTKATQYPISLLPQSKPGYNLKSLNAILDNKVNDNHNNEILVFSRTPDPGGISGYRVFTLFFFLLL